MIYRNIILCGFRGTGKSTLGKIIAQRLNWECIEMDAEIEREAGKTIAAITQQGTDWETFRTMETELLSTLLGKSDIIIAAGGGVGVNAHVDPQTDKTYGEIQRNLLSRSKESCLIVLKAPFETLQQRIEEDEYAKQHTQRPVLHPNSAALLQEELHREANAQRQKDLIVRSIIADAREVYEHRKPLYDALSSHQVDTGTQSLEDAVNEVLAIYYHEL